MGDRGDTHVVPIWLAVLAGAAAVAVGSRPRGIVPADATAADRRNRERLRGCGRNNLLRLDRHLLLHFLYVAVLFTRTARSQREEQESEDQQAEHGLLLVSPHPQLLRPPTRLLPMRRLQAVPVDAAAASARAFEAAGEVLHPQARGPFALPQLAEARPCE